MRKYILPAISNSTLQLKPCLIVDQSPVDHTLLSHNYKKMLSIREEIDVNPKAAEQKLERDLIDCINHPKIFSLRILCAIRRRQVKKANRLIVENYKTNPDSINALINYADLLLRKKKLKEFKDLFQNRFDLVDLFPSTGAFYFEDARAFYTLMAFYHLTINDRESAQLYYSNAYKIDPHHPNLFLIEKKLIKNRSLLSQHIGPFVQRAVTSLGSWKKTSSKT
ncbi:MAG: hypothetical protein K9M07_05835 [Simkaniaceae bacterium]|nr:hypothetical protein [Simkaniaceae bacterium]MCF7852741.1 hypothetical protein [Simkaniaceae bacterium]